MASAPWLEQQLSSKQPSAFSRSAHPLLLLPRANFADLPFLVNGTGPCSGSMDKWKPAEPWRARPLHGRAFVVDARMFTKD
jgi:hypothetical protein